MRLFKVIKYVLLLLPRTPKVAAYSKTEHIYINICAAFCFYMRGTCYHGNQNYAGQNGIIRRKQ